MSLKNILLIKSIGFIALYIFLFLIQFIFVYIFGLFVARIFPFKNIYISALVCSLGFIGIGMYYRYREWHDETITIESPWEISNSNYGATQMAQYALIAFIVNQIVMGAAGCIYKITLNCKKAYEVLKSNDVNLNHCIEFLMEKVLDNQRFIKFSGLANNKKSFIVLINSNVAWTKFVDGELMIGLNRDYESVVKEKMANKTIHRTAE